MNKFIKEQLQKVQIPMPVWSDDSRTIVINKGGFVSQEEEIIVGKTYKMILEDYIVNPPPSFTLASNWNGGTSPPEKNITGIVIQTMGKMIKVNSVGDTTGIKWEGWLPRKGFRI